MAYAWGPNLDGQISAMLVQPDGKVVLGGQFTDYQGQAGTNLLRLNTDGAIDASFNPSLPRTSLLPTTQAQALAAQDGGGILVGFGPAQTSSARATNIVRLNPDGTMDATFMAPTAASVSAIAVLPDGNILVGGMYIGASGTSGKAIVRLLPDGTVDGTFESAKSLGNERVRAMVVQADGKIVVGGEYLGGLPGSSLVRLNPNGTFDRQIAVIGGASIHCLASQADGQLLVGGPNMTVAGRGFYGVARLSVDGMPDLPFSTNAKLTGTVNCLAVQANGNVLAGGTFSASGPGFQGRMSNIARLNPNGTLDTGYVAIAYQNVGALALKPDGTSLIGGTASSADGYYRKFVLQINAREPAEQAILYDGASLTWHREGAAPEIRSAKFRFAKGETDWTDLGFAERIPGGWQLRDVVLPEGAVVEARGYSSSSGSIYVQQARISGGPPSAFLEAPPRVNYTGSMIVLKAWATSATPCGYQWVKDGADLPGQTNDTLVLERLELTDAGFYSLRVTNEKGTLITAATQLRVLPGPGLQATRIVGSSLPMRLMATTPIGKRVIMEASADLRQWTPISTNTPTSGTLYLMDPKSPTLDHRFYRMRVEP